MGAGVERAEGELESFASRLDVQIMQQIVDSIIFARPSPSCSQSRRSRAHALRIQPVPRALASSSRARARHKKSGRPTVPVISIQRLGSGGGGAQPIESSISSIVEIRGASALERISSSYKTSNSYSDHCSRARLCRLCWRGRFSRRDSRACA